MPLWLMHPGGRIPDQTHLAGASLARRIYPDASIPDASMFNFGKYVLSISKRVQPHQRTTLGLIWAHFQLDASGMCASG